MEYTIQYIVITFTCCLLLETFQAKAIDYGGNTAGVVTVTSHKSGSLGMPGQCVGKSEPQVLCSLCLFQLDIMEGVHCIDSRTLVCNPGHFRLITVKVHLQFCLPVQ